MKQTAEFKFKSLLLASIFISSFSLASFEPLPIGGRASGMGEAYSAIVDDVFSLYYNPAGVMQMERPEIGTYYSQLYPGLSDNSKIGRMFVGYAQPLKQSTRKAAIGLGYLALNLNGLYKEESIGATYGTEIHHDWNIGGSVKLLRKQIGSDPYSKNAIDPMTGTSTGEADPILSQGPSKSAIGLDLGVQYRLTKAYAFGFSAKNFNSPNVALGSTKDKVPSIYTAALARRLRNGSLDIEVMNYKSATNDMRFSLGGEHWFKNGFGLRAGAGMGSRNYSTVSFGASYKMESIQIDYASVLPLQGIQGTLGLQQISLIVRLGKPPVDPMEEQLTKEKQERVKAETEARFARAERDRLKKQLLELTEEKTKEKQQEEEQAAKKALEEAKQQAAEQNQVSSNSKIDSKNTEEYTSMLADYNSKVRSGISMEEKRKTLERILSQFENSNVNVSTVKRELKSLKLDESRAKKDFDLSMNFYEKLVQQGSSADERKTMLQRIIQKYQGTGIDISSAQEEMKKIK